MAEAVGIEVLKIKQESLTKAIEDLERRLADTHLKAAEFELVLRRSLEFLYHPQEAYLAASPKLRRLYNQAIWDRIEVHAEPERQFRVSGYTKEPFTTILDPELLVPLRPAVGGGDQTGTWHDGKPSWFSAELRRPGRHSFGLRRRGSKETDLAPPTGFEPVLPP